METSKEAEFVNLVRTRQKVVREGILSVIPYIKSKDLEDCAQDVWEQVWKSMESFEGRSKLITWLGAVSRNVAKDRVRREQADKRPDLTFECELEAQIDDDGQDVAYYDRFQQDLSDPEELLIAEETAYVVDECASALSPMLQLVYVLHWQEGMTVAEIASHMNHSEATVRKYTSRIRNSLRCMSESE